MITSSSTFNASTNYKITQFTSIQLIKYTNHHSHQSPST